MWLSAPHFTVAFCPIFHCSFLPLYVLCRTVNGILEMQGFQLTFPELYGGGGGGESPEGNYSDPNNTDQSGRNLTCSSGNGARSDFLIVSTHYGTVKSPQRVRLQIKYKAPVICCSVAGLQHLTAPVPCQPIAILSSIIS